MWGDPAQHRGKGTPHRGHSNRDGQSPGSKRQRGRQQRDGVLNAQRGVANRWTFYIGKDGLVKAIDKQVQGRTETAGADIAAKVKELGLSGK